MTRHATKGAFSPEQALLPKAWADLVHCGPRLMGTDGAENAVEVILKYLTQLGLEYKLHSFSLDPWSPGEPIQLEIEKRPVDAYIMLGSKFVSEGKTITGAVEYVGSFGIWDRHDWERFAVVGPDGRLLAYLLGRRDGPAIPQALPHGIADVPYIGIGADVVKELLDVGHNGLSVAAKLTVHSTQRAAMEGTNVVVDLPRRGDRFVLVGAHYDSLYSTPGAYDNASGSACLLSLADQFREGLEGLQIRLVWFGAEEWLLAGSHAYVHSLRQEGALPDFMLNIDGIGRGNTLEVWYGPDELLPNLRAILRPRAEKHGIDVKYIFPPPAGSDHAPFYQADSSVCMLTFNDLEILHRPEDTMDGDKLRNMYTTLEMVTALLRQQASI